MISLSTTQKHLLFPLALVLAAALLLGLVSSAQAASYGVVKMTSPRDYVTVPKKIQACTKCRVDARILGNVTYLANKFDMVVTQGRNKYPPSLTHGDGTAVDFVPGPGGSWKKVARAAKLAKNLKAIVYVRHFGKGDHLHISWANSCFSCSQGKLVKPRKWVKAFTVSRSATRSADYGPWIAAKGSRASAKEQARSYLRVAGRAGNHLVKETQTLEDVFGSAGLDQQVENGQCLGQVLKDHDPQIELPASQTMYQLGLLQSTRQLLKSFPESMRSAARDLSRARGIKNKTLRKGLSGRQLEIGVAKRVPAFNFCEVANRWKKNGYGNPKEQLTTSTAEKIGGLIALQERASDRIDQGNRAARSILGAAEVSRFEPWYWSESPFYGGVQAWDISLTIALENN
jgi:hypothetical protein